MFEELRVLGNLLILIIAFFTLNQTSNLTIKHSVRIAGATGARGWQEGAIFLFIYCLFLVTSVSGG